MTIKESINDYEASMTIKGGTVQMKDRELLQLSK